MLCRFFLDITHTNPHSPDAEPGKVYRPVIIHRAILGSVERMIAILTENFGGRWPFWLSPRQICIVPVAGPHKAYADALAAQFHEAGFYVDVDMTDATFPKKIRNAEVAHYNFILGRRYLIGSPAYY